MNLPEEIPYIDWYQAIEERSSRRKYFSWALSPEKIASLLETIRPIEEELESARLIISPTGFSEVIWTVVGSYGLVTGAESYAVIIKDKSKGELQAEVEAGLLGETLILEATAQDIDTCWVGGMFEKEKVLSRHELQGDEEIAAITPLGEAKKDLTFTEKMAKKIVGSQHRKPLRELCLNDYTEEDLHEVPEWISWALKSARQAPSAVNRQPWRFELLMEDNNDNNINKIKLNSAKLERTHGFSPYLDCGIALLHLLVGAKAALEKEEKTKEVNYSLLTPPEVAEVYLSC